MKLERCIVNMGNLTDKTVGNVELPNNAFGNVPNSCKFLAVKNKESEVVKLLMVPDPKSRVFEVYCEMVDSQGTAIMLKQLDEICLNDDRVTLATEVQGICDGKSGKYPCTFHGFIFVSGNVTELVDRVKKSIESIDVVKEVLIDEL